MNHEEYRQAAEYWDVLDADARHMPEDEIKQAVEAYLAANNTCALATGTGSFIRCTPIEYTYLEGVFYMFTEGGHKFIGLESNKQACLAIYDNYGGFGSLKGMQVSGYVDLIEPFSPEYNEVAAKKKIPLAALQKLHHPMHLLKMTPTHIDFLNSDFKKQGYASRQALDF